MTFFDITADSENNELHRVNQKNERIKFSRCSIISANANKTGMSQNIGHKTQISTNTPRAFSTEIS